MDRASALSLAQTGLLFVPSDSRTPRDKIDRRAVHRQMCEALGLPASQVPVPTVVIAPAALFDDVWSALQGRWSTRLKENFHALHKDGEIHFKPR